MKKEVPDDGIEAAPKHVGLTDLIVSVLSVSEIGVFKLYLTMIHGVKSFKVHVVSNTPVASRISIRLCMSAIAYRA